MSSIKIILIRKYCATSALQHRPATGVRSGASRIKVRATAQQLAALVEIKTFPLNSNLSSKLASPKAAKPPSCMPQKY